MPFFLGLSFAFVAILVLAWPILRRRRSEAARSAMPDELQEAVRQRDRVYDDIRTLVLDHELGNVPDLEYTEKLAAFRMEAARAVRDLEQLEEAGSRLDDDLENEVLELRRAWGSVSDTATCEICDGEVDARVLLCPRCEMPQDQGAGRERTAADEEQSP